jgi:NAD+ kinase
MKSHFRHVALIGKYQAGSGAAGRQPAPCAGRYRAFSARARLRRRLRGRDGGNMGITGHATLDVPGIGAHCDLGLVVGGDGTMLGIGRQLARTVPLIGINQGRLGFITDIPLDGYRPRCCPCCTANMKKTTAA